MESLPVRLEKAVKKAMKADEVTVANIPRGYRVLAVRGKFKRKEKIVALDEATGEEREREHEIEGWERELKFDIYAHDNLVITVNVRAPGNTGWLAAAESLARDVLAPEFGVKHFQFSAANDQAAAKISKNAPYEPVGNGVYRWEIE